MTRHALSQADVRNKVVWIYGLADPISGELRYIGKSSNPSGRISSHRHDGSLLVRQWFATLDAVGLEPRIDLLFAILPGNNAAEFEREFIGRYPSDRLLNVHLPDHRVNRVDGHPWTSSSLATGPTEKRLTDGARALRAYLDEWGLSLGAFCTAHGLDRIHLQRILNGDRGQRVSVDFAWDIERATGGVVQWFLWRSETIRADSSAA